MTSFKSILIISFLIGVVAVQPLYSYPYDGFALTGITRLLYLQFIKRGEIKGKFEPIGKHKTLNEIHLNLYGEDGTEQLPEVDSDLTQALEAIIPNRDRNYSVALLDITPCRDIRYAERNAERGYQPGSVGKLAIVTGLFNELQRLYPGSFEKRRTLLKNKKVRAGDWAMYDHHTVPFFDPETKRLHKRTVRESDVFSLYEWADHMMSVSNNGAASVLWREVVLIREFGERYPDLEEADAEIFFDTTDRKELTELAMEVVNEPLLQLCISEDEWRLGSLFTRGGKNRITGKGGSTGTPRGLMKWMLAMESGRLIDRLSSLEIKRLMYVTDRRIRYAATNELDSAAVYFKSGSFYKCDRKRNPGCGKYKGNVYNYMNSIAIVEQPNGSIYMVALMTNVLNRNSNWDHRRLAKDIDRLIANFD
jgi:hypothetical protein